MSTRTKVSNRHIITIDIDRLQIELEAQELYLDEAQWLSLIQSIKKAEVYNTPHIYENPELLKAGESASLDV